MRVGETLNGTPVTLSRDTSLAAAERLLQVHGVRHAAVVDHGSLLGVVSLGSLAAARPSAATSLTVAEVRARLQQVRVGEIMDMAPVLVGPTTPIGEAARLMRELQVDVLAVCSGSGFVGLLEAGTLLAVLELQLRRPSRVGTERHDVA